MMLRGNRFLIKTVLTRSVSKSTKTSASAPTAVSKNLNEVESTAFKPSRATTVQFPAKIPDTIPLVKGFFCATVDAEKILYPEIIEQLDLQKFDESNQKIAAYVDDAYKNGEMFIEVNKTVLEDFRRMDLFKTSVGREYGNQCNSVTESLLAHEYTAVDPSLALVTATHQIACRVINQFGTPDQKEKYLPKLTCGEMIATICIFEDGNIQQATMKTKAEQDQYTDEWSINGTKHAVLNSNNADLFIVLAQTRAPDVSGDMGDTISAFLIERSTPGVTVCERDITTGCNGVYQSSVKFDKISVGPEHILSDFGRGNEVGSIILMNLRLHLSLINTIQLKQIISYLSKYCVETEEKLQKLCQLLPKAPQAVQLRDVIAKTTCAVYALESMLYLTAGFADTYENADIDVESCILKIYSQEQLGNVVQTILNFMDQSVIVKGHPMEQYIRNFTQLQSYGEAKEVLRLFVGIAGIQHVGATTFEDIKKRRNPLFNPAFITKLFFTDDTIYNNPKSTLNLKENLHTGFDPCVKRVEEAIMRLKISTRTAITKHGRDIVDKHSDLLRLSDMAVTNFAMFAALSRASRSVCLRLPEAGNEHLIVNCLTQTGNAKVKRLSEDIENGSYYTFDEYYGIIAKMLIRSKQYFPAHPLSRFF